MRIICFGDSNTYGYDPRDPLGSRYSDQNRWVDLLAAQTGWQVRNRGKNGRQIPHRRSAMDQTARMLRANGQADALVVMLGTNDLLQGASAAEAARRMEAFLEELLPLCKAILLVAPPPMVRGAWVTEAGLTEESVRLAEQYGAIARRLGILFADAGQWGVEMAFDGVHFTESGHCCFARRLRQVLEEYCLAGS